MDMSKDARISRERSRLAGIFKDIDPGKRKLVAGLIDNAAFTRVSLEDLQDIINEEGYIVEYQNGENQYGTKQSDAVKTHIAMTKNLATVIKQLCDLAPAEQKKSSRLAALLDSK